MDALKSLWQSYRKLPNGAQWAIIGAVFVFCCVIPAGVGGFLDPEETPTTTTVKEEKVEVEETTTTLIPFTVAQEKDISFAGCERVTFKVVVADDATQEQVDNVMASVMAEHEDDWDDLTVWAYGTSDNIDGSYTKGILEQSDC